VFRRTPVRCVFGSRQDTNAERDITDIVVYHCLRKGRVHIKPAYNATKRNFECVVEYFEAGQRITVIAAIKNLERETTIVITAYGDGEDGKF